MNAVDGVTRRPITSLLDSVLNAVDGATRQLITKTTGSNNPSRRTDSPLHLSNREVLRSTASHTILR